MAKVVENSPYYEEIIKMIKGYDGQRGRFILCDPSREELLSLARKSDYKKVVEARKSDYKKVVENSPHYNEIIKMIKRYDDQRGLFILCDPSRDFSRGC